MGRQTIARNLVAAIRNLDEVAEIRLVHEAVALDPNFPEMTTDDEADIAAIEAWGA